MLVCPVCDTRATSFLPFGLVPRGNARCPHCGSLERHRLAWSFFRRRTDLFNGKPKRFLHVAPEACLSGPLRSIPGLNYLSSDFQPGRAMVQMDLRKIDYPDESFDIIYCSHVLEHIQEDAQAIAELQRVLTKTGWAFFQVPILGEKTYEDPLVTHPAERERLFGQSDHVRKYGLDFVDRLRKGGFYGRPYRVTDILTPAEAVLSGLSGGSTLKGEYGFLCIK